MTVGPQIPAQPAQTQAAPAQSGKAGWNTGGTIQASFVISTMPTAQNPNNVVRRTEAELNQEFLQKSPQELVALGTKLKQAGYNTGPVNGKPTRRLRSAYLSAITDLDSEISAGQQLDINTYLARESSPDTAQTGPNVSVSRTVFTEDQARTLANIVARDLIDQELSGEQLAKITQKLIKAQRANPSVTRYSKSGGVQTSETTPGIDAQQFLIQQIAQTDEAKANQAMGFYSTFKNLLGVQ